MQTEQRHRNLLTKQVWSQNSKCLRKCVTDVSSWEELNLLVGFICRKVQATDSLNETEGLSVKREKTNRCNNQMIIINFCLNMFRASICPSSGEQRLCVTAFVVLFWFCWMWLVAVVGALRCRMRAVWRFLFNSLLLTSVSTCFRHHYAHLQENKGPATAFGVLFWFCWM
jgi:hypothetical protein